MSNMTEAEATFFQNGNEMSKSAEDTYAVEQMTSKVKRLDRWSEGSMVQYLGLLITLGTFFTLATWQIIKVIGS